MNLEAALHRMAPVRRRARTLRRTARYFHGSLLARPPDRDQAIVAWGFVAAVFWAAAGVAAGGTLPLPAGLFFALAGLVAAVAAIDARWSLIPDELLLWIVLVGAADLCHGKPAAAALLRLCAAAGVAALGYGLRALAERWFGRDALGQGDVKLVAAATLFVGPGGLLVLLPLALASALATLLLIRLDASARPDAIPLGPHLGLALLWSLLLGIA